MSDYQPRRAAGSGRIHAVDLATGVSACGHKPTDTRGMKRAGWRLPFDSHISNGELCPWCLGQFIEREMKQASPRKRYAWPERIRITERGLRIIRKGIEEGAPWEAIGPLVGVKPLMLQRFFGSRTVTA